MTTNELRDFIKGNAQFIADNCREYCETANINISEFSEEQQHQLKIAIAVSILKDLVKAPIKLNRSAF